MAITKIKKPDLPPIAEMEDALAEFDTAAVTKIRQGYARIYALGNDKVRFVEKWLLDAKPALALARHIQTEWHVLCDVNEKTLGKQLTRFAAELLELKRLHKIDKKIGKTTASGAKAESLLKRMEQSIDTVDALGDLCNMQYARVMKMYDKEKDMPLNFDSLRNEIALLEGMLQRLSNLQMNVGILRKIDPKVKIHMELPEELKQFYSRVDSTRALQTAMAKAFQLIIGEEVSDGEYVEVPAE